ncbi:fasciclin-like arabinogalactan protein 21 [Telopea speciosissima]|uniref:fasciclin-like arabinogalactan protein 21 n=1 Tax=Telopea speciosissima TaxID=54955 RepID=UPI001CC477F9|nr:fasciclin-like arabinogalactan protein 21 [Telopea speciosissima]
MAFSCPRWWHALVYLAISVTLAVIVISTTFHSKPKTTQVLLSPKSDSRNLHGLSLGLYASRALRKSGFKVMATFLDISPLLFHPSTSELTIFAIQDPPISNISLPPLLTRELLRYHTSPSKLFMEDLLKKPQGSCVSTLLPGKQLAITKVNAAKGKIEINRVLITHPDIFVQGPLSIHGVLGPFVHFSPEDIEQDKSPIASNHCNLNSSLVANVTKSTKSVPWRRIIRSLGSNGFVSFAIGLRSVLDVIRQEYGGLSSVTLFAPPELIDVASPLPMLERIVKFHISTQLFTYRELASLPEKASLMTLVPGQDHKITNGVVDFRGILAINNVEITVPDVVLSKRFVIHGISRAFEMVKLPAATST